jgi:hypothetical protein
VLALLDIVEALQRDLAAVVELLDTQEMVVMVVVVL